MKLKTIHSSSKKEFKDIDSVKLIELSESLSTLDNDFKLLDAARYYSDKYGEDNPVIQDIFGNVLAIGTEGFFAGIKKFFVKIGEMIKAIFDSIVNFFKKLFGIKNKEEKELKEKVLKGNTKKDKLDVMVKEVDEMLKEAKKSLKVDDNTKFDKNVQEHLNLMKEIKDLYADGQPSADKEVIADLKLKLFYVRYQLKNNVKLANKIDAVAKVMDVDIDKNVVYSRFVNTILNPSPKSIHFPKDLDLSPMDIAKHYVNLPTEIVKDASIVEGKVTSLMSSTYKVIYKDIKSANAYTEDTKLLSFSKGLGIAIRALQFVTWCLYKLVGNSNQEISSKQLEDDIYTQRYQRILQIADGHS